MLVIGLRKGGTKCSSSCPFYEASGIVRGVRGMPLETHCSGTMQEVIVDCDKWNPHEIEKLEVSEEQWKVMQKAVHMRAKKVRKPYDPNHEVIHPVGCEWTRARWNAEKSKNV